MKKPDLTDSVPPVNIDAEEAILGGILLDPNALNRVRSQLMVNMFSLRTHRVIYKAILELDNAEKITDLMNVSEFLANRQLLDTVGGTTKLGQLLNRTVSATNIDRYVLIVIDKWKRRELITLGHQLVDLGYQTELELFELTQTVTELVASWTNSDELTDRPGQIGKMSYTAIAKQDNEHYEETIKLEAEINLDQDPRAQIKKLQEQAQNLLPRKQNINSENE